jgi:3-hydroxybutyryl-CoA dehydrogenase
MSLEELTGPLTLALIGAGKAGRSLAAAAVRAGHHVVLEDVLPSRLREALEEIPTEGMPGTLETVTTVEDAVRNADLAIDFVPDELESKLEIVCMVDRMAPPKTILCIQTRALSVTDLANCTYRADRCIGVWFDTERTLVTLGAQTSPGTMETVTTFFRSVTPYVDTAEEAVAPVAG